MERIAFRDIAAQEWERSAAIRADVGLDAFVVMPNHIHGVVWLGVASSDSEAQHAAQLQPNWRIDPSSLGAFVRGYKSAVTREINLVRSTPAARVWQPNYYEHIVRDDNDLGRTRQYIEGNPGRWHADREDPSAVPDEQKTAFWKSLDPAVVAQRAAPSDST